MAEPSSIAIILRIRVAPLITHLPLLCGITEVEEEIWMAGCLQNSEGRPPPERRATQRFPIVAPLEYKAFRRRVLVREGVGRTINFGSRGILFQTDPPLEPDLRLELSIAWPVLHQMRSHLRVHAFGEIVRIKEGEVAVRLGRPQFEKE